MSKNNTPHTATLTEAAAAAPSLTLAPREAPAPGKTNRAYVRSLHGTFIHPFTNEKITGDGKKIEIDSWVAVQIEAGKLALVVD